MADSLSKRQYTRTSNIFYETGKGFILASLAIPILTPIQAIITVFEYISIGLLFVYISIKMEGVIDKKWK